ncbi:hypothetical protein D3C87_161060 [compost metagenome]
MYKILLLSILLVRASLSFAQINYQKDFNNALKKAAESKQPLFINIGATKKLPNKSGIDNPDVVQFYNKNFVSYTVSLPNPEALSLMRKYQLRIFPAYLFLDQNGVLIVKGDKSSSTSKFYLDLANQALNKLTSNSSLGDYEAKYKAGNLSKDFLKEYITLRQQLGMLDNAKLIDKYVDYLTVASFNDFNEVLFILKAGPFTSGKAYKLTFTNPKIRDSIYKTRPSTEKKEINRRIIQNTQNEAIATKSPTMAYSVSNFARGSWGKNYAAGNKQSTYLMLDYHKGVKDTANFYRQAQYYYDEYYMKISADSIKKLAKKEQGIKDSLTASIKKYMLARKNVEAQSSGPITKYTYSKISTSGTINNVAKTLNNAAWDYYILGTRNMTHLTKALLWSKRAIEIAPSPEYYDTMAHIFYRMQLYDEALLNQNKAIEMLSGQKNSKDRLSSLKEEAEKMKQRKL